ncbi:MAG: hypothetical protein J0H94_02105 [Rhizobiales bacterium]|nr:hypothetical protein [Hyphomicrobiales bacterium]
MIAMIPLQIEDAGYTGAVAFEDEAPARIAEAGGKITRRNRGLRGDLPTRQGGAGSDPAGLAEEQAHDPAFARPERQAPAGGEVELPRISADFRESRGEAGTAEPLLESPQSLAGTAHPDQDQPGRIEAELGEAGRIGKAAFATGGSLQNPENRPLFRDQGEERRGKAGGGGNVRQAAPDFMQGVPPDAAAEGCVKGGDSEGQMTAPPWPERRGLLGQPPGIADFFAGLSADLDAREMALDLGDPASQPGNILLCHGSAPAHGDNSLVPCLFY